MAEDFLPGLNGGPVFRNPDVPVKSARVCQWPGVQSSATVARGVPVTLSQLAHPSLVLLPLFHSGTGVAWWAFQNLLSSPAQGLYWGEV